MSAIINNQMTSTDSLPSESFPIQPNNPCLYRPATMAMLKASWFLLAPLLFLSASAISPKGVVKVTNNPADQLVAALNDNRTVHKSSSLYDNPGLACLALQYIKAYQGDCGAVDDKKPAESEFAEIFAPNCGILASSLSPITGRLLGCQSKYVTPSKALSDILMGNSKGLEIVYDKNHTEVGAAVSGSDGGGPYFWGVLFSNGKRNGSFAFEEGVPKISRPGCFSGANDECSGASRWTQPFSLWSFAATALMAGVYAFGS